MADLRALGAIAEGINNALINITKTRAARDKLREEKELLDIKKKRENLELKEMEITHSPEALALKKKKTQAEAKLKDIDLETKEHTLLKLKQTQTEQLKSIAEVATNFIRFRGGGMIAGIKPNIPGEAPEFEGIAPRIMPSEIAQNLGLERVVKRGNNVSW